MRLAAILTPIALTGCFSALTGNEGNFQFSYDADDRLLDFNKPIAVGAYLDLEVRDVGARQAVTLSDASVATDAVLTVTSFADHVVTVQAVGEGQGLLQVAGTTRAGDALTDSVNLLARVPEVHRLWHTCTEEPEAGYLANARAFVPFDLEMANGQPVIGYGYYPITASSTALSLNATDSIGSHMAIDVGPQTGPSELTSDLDGTQITMNVVEPGDIDGAVEPIAFVLEDIDAGDTNAFYVLPSVGGMPVCQASVEKEVVSDTPDTCTVRDGSVVPDGAGGNYESGWFDVTGVAEGTCRFTVTYPSGNRGAGASQQFEVEIEP